MPDRSAWGTRVRTTLVSLGISSGLSLLLAGCGGGGGSTPAAPAAPPPPQPLGWNSVPEGITVEVGETETFTATLTAAIDANYTISANSEAVEVSGEALRAGVFQGSVTGVEAGEVEISIAASQPGFVTATTSIEVVVEDHFDLTLWRELVFDALDCPRSATNENCERFWGESKVEDRITSVLSSQPNFHLLSRFRSSQFTSSQMQTLRAAIRDSVEQITGETFTGEISSGAALREESGWVDVVPAGHDFFQGVEACGFATVGETEGLILLNMELLDDCDLFAVTMHETGHALGFFHVLDSGDTVMAPIVADIPRLFSEGEQFHAQLAWELGPGTPYSPDPRKTSSSTRMTMGSPPGTSTPWNLSLENMVICPLH